MELKMNSIPSLLINLINKVGYSNNKIYYNAYI